MRDIAAEETLLCPGSWDDANWMNRQCKMWSEIFFHKYGQIQETFYLAPLLLAFFTQEV